MILVCGATGTIGSQVLRHFSSAGIRVRALQRRPASEKSPLPQGAEIAVADLSRPETLPPALDGVRKLFLLSANGDRQSEQEENLIAAAAKNGVSHVVKLSVMGAGPAAASEFGRLHARIEDSLKNSGMQWTMVRPNMMMQNLRWYRAGMAEGILPMALGDAAVSHVDAGDVARVVFHALTGNDHAGQTYTVTGPEALTGDEVAAIIAAATKRAISYRSLPMSDLRAFLEKNGESKFVVDAEIELFEAWSRGAGNQVTSTVEDVTGVKPKTLAGFAAEHVPELV